MLSRLLALILLLLISPLIFILYFLVKFGSKGPFIFSQIRIGKDKKPFYMYKIRTMIEIAETLKKNYLHLNEADGPVFKIRNDPRYTKIGKLLSHSGLDEIPQLLNIIKGEMAFVGPRPFPTEEAAKIGKEYTKRFSVLPGIISIWVAKGGHSLTFKEWMQLDLEYIRKKSVYVDLVIVIQSIIKILNTIIRSSHIF